MNQADVLQALKLEPTQAAKKYAAKICSLLTLINLLEKLDGFKVLLNGIKGNNELAQALPLLKSENFVSYKRYREVQDGQDNLKEIYGEFPEWQTVTVSHSKGQYTFPFPTGNKLYNVIAAMAGEPVQETEVKKKPIKTIELPGEVLQAIAKAKPFASDDDLRPAMQCILLNFENNKLQVVATDAHRLFYSRLYKCNSGKKKLQVLIHADSVKKIASLKTKKETITLNLFGDDTGDIAGTEFKTLDARFPDYKVVIPEYTTCIKFDRKAFISNVEKVEVYANKSTHQIVLNINGQIGFSAQDVDFSFEGNAKMPYVEKQFPDLEIAFNGKFLCTTLNTFKDDVVSMYHDGKRNTTCGIFSDGKDNILVMPLMLNN